MPDRQELLEELTLKGQCEDNAQRVFQTLNSDPENLTQHRTTVVLAGIIDKLVEKGLITEQDLDDILLQSKG